MKRYSIDSIERQITLLLTSWGMREDSATTAARVMAETDASGVDSHGISMVMRYEEQYRSGSLNVAAKPTVVREADAHVTIDAGNGLGHPAAVLALEIAMQMAAGAGIAIASVVNSHHFGAAGVYVRRAAQRGMLALLTSTTSIPSVIPVGGAKPVMGTNPLAFAAPVTGNEPLVVDMSTSTVAVNKVKAYALAGKTLPPGWVTDRAGTDLTDADQAFTSLMNGDGAGLAPLGGSTTLTGGHKGMGLSLMVQALSASLAGAPAPGHGGAHHQVSHVLIVIDPRVAGVGVDAGAVNDAFLSAVRSAGAPGEPVTIPGEPEATAADDRRAHGVPLPAALLEQISAVCTRSECPIVLETR